MLDPNLPLELDDGREVTLISDNSIGDAFDSVTVRITGPARRDRPMNDFSTMYSYYIKDGVWAGGTAETYYVLQNVARPEMYIPEDWS